MKRRHRTIVIVLVALGIVHGVARPVEADSKHGVRLAEVLFDEGKAAMDRGDLKSACAKLEESRRLDPAGGTQLALAVCYERATRYASAWRAYREALAHAQRDGRSDRQAIAQARIASLEPQLSRIVVDVSPAVAGLSGLSVRVDELELRTQSWGLSVPYDGGTYSVIASAPGYRTFSRAIQLAAEGDRRRILISQLKSIAGPAPEPRRCASRERLPEAMSASERVSMKPASAQQAGKLHRALGYVFGGVSALSLGTGAYFGARAFSAKMDMDDACAGNVCSPGTEMQRQEALLDARLSTVFVGAGLLAAGVSLYFFLTEPGTRAGSMAFGVGGGAGQSVEVQF